MRKINLMYITHDLAIGGLQQVVVSLCRTIDRDRFNVSVLCLRSLGEFVQDVEAMGIKVILLEKKKGKTDYFPFFRVAKILRQESIDIIHTHNTQPFIDGTIAALIAGVKTIVHTDHARFFPDKKRYMFAEWVMSKFAYKVVGVSEHTSSSLIRYEHISPRKILTITNGITRGIYSQEVDTNEIKRELGIEKCRFVIGLGVRLEEQKGISNLIKAMPSILEVCPDLVLLVAGRGSLESALKELATDLGVAKSVYFIGPRKDIPVFLKTLDLYVLPSHFEGLPMVLLEAMAAGCPIVATDVGGNSTAIRNGENGILVEPNNPKMLAEAILKVLGDYSLRQSFIHNGHKRFDELFSVEKMAHKYQELYISGFLASSKIAGH